MGKENLIINEDYYIDEKGRYVFTEKFHLKRGFCCKSYKGCKHCPYTEEEENKLYCNIIY